MRLPSVAQLKRNRSNADSILFCFARDLRLEIDGLQEGWVYPHGMSRSEALRQSRRNLKRVFDHAIALGIDHSALT